MKRYGLVTLFALLVALFTGWIAGAFRGTSREVDAVRAGDPLPKAPPLREEASSGTAPTRTAASLEGSAAADPPSAGPLSPERAHAAPPTRPPPPAALISYRGTTPPGWEDAPPAQRPHAIRPPRPGGRRVSPGGRGSVGPTGHWTRFPPPLPPRGKATLHAVVADREGAPVAGADVYLGPPVSLRQSAVSFGDLRKLGTTDEHGELVVPELPAGAAILAGNLQGLLNGPRGLDARSSIPVLLVAGATIRAELALPLDVDAFGGVTGRVVDTEGRPIAGAAVASGFFRTRTTPDGRYEAPRLTAGPQRISASRTGYAPASVTVDVLAGSRTHAEIVLAFRESGGLDLEGRVLDDAGAPIPGASLYLIDGGGRGTLRSLRTDSDGSFRFDHLPERLRTAACRLQAGKHQEGYPTRNVQFEEGLVDTRVELRLPPRRVKAVFHLRDAASGNPLARCRIEPERLDDPVAGVRGFLGTNAEGRFEHWFDAGSYRFTVEAPDHRPGTVDASLSQPGSSVDLELRLAASASPSIDITLRVRVKDAVTDAPVGACTLLVLDAAGTEVARFEGSSETGVYSMPAPSGSRTLRVSASGHETSDQALSLSSAGPEAEVTVHLRPR